jgi:hypothetical protein
VEILDESLRPGALKHTPVHSLMPEPLQRWLEAQPRQQIGRALGLLAALSQASGFGSGCTAVVESIQHSVTDVIIPLKSVYFELGAEGIRRQGRKRRNALD